MQLVRVVRLIVAGLVLWSGSACGDDGAPPTKARPRSDGGNEDECTDKDADGFGRGCDLGADCDDGDPEVTDECTRCAVPAKGCECEPGTMWRSCDPPDIKTNGGVLVCKEGTRYCREGVWSDCEAIGDYVLVPDE